MRAAGDFGVTTVVNRYRPDAFVRLLVEHRRFDPAVRLRLSDDLRVVVHPFPIGPLETSLLCRVIRKELGAGGRVVLWIADPKSAPVLSRFADVPRTRLVSVFDAYDAWDLSPLVRGPLRRRAARRGYQAAARHADIVFANTTFMLERMRRLGARNVRILPNGAPDGWGASETPAPDREARPTLLYVGRVHERLDVDLLVRVAHEVPEAEIAIRGPVERIPPAWDALADIPNVSVRGPIVGADLRQALSSAAALLLPHRVDDYTRSQDAMKAWDAIAVGTPVVGTAVPPLSGWPAGLALVVSDGRSFVAAVRDILAGAMEGSRAERLSYAAANTWSVRAASATTAIRELTG
jgi:glycosyltransferase involved in cell wall biosynthesis